MILPNPTPVSRRRSAPLPCGLTEKMLRFAERVADGCSLADAYRGAFSTGGMKDKTIRDEASRLAKNPGVTRAIEAIRAERDAENHMRWRSKEDHIWELVWKLVDDPRVPVRSKIKALTLAAQMAGLIAAS
jgi:hypothetical protein